MVGYSLRAIAKKIAWWQAAEIIGISDRQMRRWKERYQEFGYDGLFDRRRGQPSPKRVPLATVEQVQRLFHPRIAQPDLVLLAQLLVKVAHIQIKIPLPIQPQHLIAREGKRGVHRKQRERRPLPGILVHIDGSEPGDN